MAFKKIRVDLEFVGLKNGFGAGMQIYIFDEQPS